MGLSFSSGSIEQLKQQVDIVDVVGRCVSLKRSGSNYKGVCPFHSEKTPSFVVSEQKQIFTCFGCGASGDVIEFVKRFYNLEFGEAVEKLAGEYGITLERRAGDDHRDQYYRVNQMAARFFYRAFTEQANPGYAYMKRRGITPPVLKKFGIGYADGRWDSLYQHLRSQGVEDKVMQELGLISQSHGRCYDRFRNRVMFPIINTGGKVIGFGGRAIDPEDSPKYLNSPESRVFQKKNNLYGLNITRQQVGKAGCLILVEGYMDAIALYQSGVEHVAASLGTALTENQAKLIKRYTRDVVLSYDADAAGRAAALRGLEILRRADCKVKVLHVTDGKDPDEYVKKNGREAFLRLVEQAMPYGDYRLAAAREGLQLDRDADQIEYMQRAVAILRDLRPVEQAVYIRKLAEELHISETAIQRELMGPDSAPQRPTPRPREHREEEAATEISAMERTLLRVVLTDGQYLRELAKTPDILRSPFARKLYDMLLEMDGQEAGIDAEALLDRLSPEEGECLQGILEHVILGGNEARVFAECVQNWKRQQLAAEEQRLIALLSMADEEQNQDKVAELTAQLMQVQRERKQKQ